MNADVSSITWFNLPVWAWRTAGASMLTYRASRRSWSASRVRALIRPDLDRPIFLVGAARSGTTFLGAALSASPEISYHFEPVATKAAARYVYEESWSEARAARFYRRVYSWLMRVHADGDLRFAEKTPRNVFVVPFLARAFPDSVFIHIVRDGRDAALSLSKRPWLQASQAASGRREPGGYPYGPSPRFWVEEGRWAEFAATSDLHRCSWAWRAHTQAGLDVSRELPADRYLELRYEELVGAPAEHARLLTDFLGLADPRAVTAALEGARIDSVGRWRSELTAEQLSVISGESGELLERLGYSGS